ncbi:unnamed protein product [Spirodela intermedia]|uniref:Uncharacterized protein n=1 Tax=Spirodela intermedia TaxID=51605 RepID=A0A7I8J0W9_SPIIN|nr:unnamed protein product [Spirodela intermedia]CAA6662960.1 unnamed protein product [Spirodela intermedia]
MIKEREREREREREKGWAGLRQGPIGPLTLVRTTTSSRRIGCPTWQNVRAVSTATWHNISHLRCKIGYSE